MIEVRVIADSINPVGQRITTVVATYPRFIHAEVGTHTLLVRNSASSRAIPASKMIDAVRELPAMPVEWGRNQRGMRAGEPLADDVAREAEHAWLHASKDAANNAQVLQSLGLHKQVVNRVLEPFAHITTILTATEWGNFFNLRCDPEAQPEFQELAYLILDAYVKSRPTPLGWGEWHLPFADRYLDDNLTITQLLKITTARCARVSYLNFEGDFDHEKDYELHDRLITSGHMSPTQHAAMSDPEPDYSRVDGLSGPRNEFNFNVSPMRSQFVGWLPYRKTIPNEHRRSFDHSELLQKRQHG